MFKLTKEQLLEDLYVAFNTASKRKNNKTYVLKFRNNLDNNLIKLRDELWDRTYIPGSSVCFIVTHPKKREVFAAQFRDRIVHHLYFNYTHILFENTFIYDSYSCIKNKGTHFGINRLRHHILQESENYNKKCYVLKMDIKGYFMHINRQLLCKVVKSSLDKMATHKISVKNEELWQETIDIEFIKYLTEVIALLNPTTNCTFRSEKEMWDDLAPSKSLFKVKEGCGLPIGNLTSQLFSNIFLNKLDQFIKRTLKCKHYGRYVDDFYIVSSDKQHLHNLIPQIEEFLKNELCLEINKGKTTITEVKLGVSFLGAFLKPYRTYIDNKSKNRIKRQLYNFQYTGNYDKNVVNSINSFLGIFSHYKSYNIRKNIIKDINKLFYIGAYNRDLTKFVPYYKIKNK